MGTIYLFLAEGFEEMEALAVVDVVRRAGLSIRTVSVTGNIAVTSSHKVTINADMLFDAKEISKKPPYGPDFTDNYGYTGKKSIP